MGPQYPYLGKLPFREGPKFLQMFGNATGGLLEPEHFQNSAGIIAFDLTA